MYWIARAVVPVPLPVWSAALSAAWADPEDGAFVRAVLAVAETYAMEGLFSPPIRIKAEANFTFVNPTIEE
jgi:hypothetical protein